MQDYNPNQAADPNAGIFGLPFSEAESKVIFIPAPWDPTTSYGAGTVLGPEAIRNASGQIDLYHPAVTDPYLQGMFMRPISESWIKENQKLRKQAAPIKEALGEISDQPELQEFLANINSSTRKFNQHMYQETRDILDAGKIPGIIGGDHSVPLGAFMAAAEKFPKMGILHFDAHSDTRNAYLGFQDAHASIMYNARTQIDSLGPIVQVGIRDYCQEEKDFVSDPKNSFHVFWDRDLKRKQFEGIPFSEVTKEIIAKLPSKVWISFDIDGLNPFYCPHTGTPVPGGLEFDQAVYFIEQVARSGRTIVGFDLVEVAPELDDQQQIRVTEQAQSEWDANVGMRLLYQLASFALASQKVCDFRN